MNKFDLITLIADKAHLDFKKAEISVNVIFDCMADALKRDERIELRSFGSFQNRRYEKYTGRNPKTGALVEVAAKIVPFFKVGKALKELVAGTEASLNARIPKK
ncbi:HU family DNA-binding protein [Bdellovibrionota bacterium FG-2]